MSNHPPAVPLLDIRTDRRVCDAGAVSCSVKYIDIGGRKGETLAIVGGGSATVCVDRSITTVDMREISSTSRGATRARLVMSHLVGSDAASRGGSADDARSTLRSATEL